MNTNVYRFLLGIAIVVILLLGYLLIARSNNTISAQTQTFQAAQQSNQNNATLIQYRAKFLDQCTRQSNEIVASVSASSTAFQQEAAQAKQDCSAGNYEFDTSTAFACYNNVLVMYSPAAYIDQCIKYNMNLINPTQSSP